MNWLTSCVRLWLGIWMLFWGLNWWLRFTPQPTGLGSHELHMAFIHSGLFSVAKLVEVLLGVALLTNRFVPASLVLSFPVTFIVAWIHFVIESPAASGYFVFFGHLYLLLAYLPYYKTMLRMKSVPATSVRELRESTSTPV